MLHGISISLDSYQIKLRATHISGSKATTRARMEWADIFCILLIGNRMMRAEGGGSDISIERKKGAGQYSSCGFTT